MERQTCALCNKNKTALCCDSCGDASCKKCVQFVDSDFFEHIVMLPEKFRDKTFCLNCFNQGLGDQLNQYREIAEKSKKVDVFSKSQTKETRRIKRVEEPIQVKDCEDRKDTLLRLAFRAAEKGYDTIVDVEILSKKVGEGKSHKKVLWSGTGVPVDPKIKK